MGEDILDVHAALRPDKPALVLGEGVRTYAELNRRAIRLAHALMGLGVGRGESIAILTHNSLEGSEVGAAARKLGAVSVPINFRLREAELAYVLDDSGARVVVVGPDLVEVVEAARARLETDVRCVAVGEVVPDGWLAYEQLLAEAPDGELEEPDVAGLGPSMIYTSGTTGHPKGAVRPQGVPLHRVQQMIATFALTPDDVHLMPGPNYHSAVSFFTSITIALGGTVVIMPRFEPEEALRLIARHRVTTTFMAPTLLHRIMDLPQEVRGRYAISSMRALILGAAPCPSSLKERATAFFGETLWEFYGASETGINLVLRPEDQLRKPGSAGLAVEGQDLLLLDDEGNPVPDGQPGLLWVRNDWLSQYHQRPDDTRHAMRDGYFTVGDVARRDAEGYYYICDRRTDMIISGGVNIYPAEVEACLHSHPAVRDVAVIGVPDEEWGEAVKAVVVLQPGAQAGESELIDWCRTRIADYKRPRSVDFAADLPRDAAGKLLKRTIRTAYWPKEGRLI